MRQSEVFENGEMRKKIELLKNNPHLGAHRIDIRRRAGHRNSIYDHRARVGMLQSVNTAEHRGFARAAGANQHEDSAALDGDTHAIQCLDLGKPFTDVFDLDYRLGHDFYCSSLGSTAAKN